MSSIVPEWHARGLCQEVDPDLFFPEHGAGPSKVGVAKRICDRCEVKAECRQWAIDTGQVYGVWGGTSESERRHIRRLARAKAARLAREAASC